MNSMTVFLLLSQYFIHFGETLICYECTKLHGQNCYDPINTEEIKAVDCRNSSFIIGNQDNTQYQCVAYMDRYKNNRTNVVRKCARKNDFDFCAIHRNDAEQQGFLVEKCVTCFEDYCNAGYRPGNWQVVFMVFVVIYLKYMS